MKCPEKWTIYDAEEAPPTHTHRCKYDINEDHGIHICECGAIKPK